MLKKFLYYGDGMEIGRGRFRGLVWGVALLCCSLLYSPLHAGAETCITTDNIVTIAAGASYIIALKENGTVAGIGGKTHGELKATSWMNIKSIAAGSWHTVGLKEDGTVVAAADYDYGYGHLNVSSWTNIKAIAAGSRHTVGLREDGTVVAVGSNASGQLNVSDWTNITAIAAGYYHTAGLKDDGTVVTTGGVVSSWTNIKAIAAGEYHIVGLKEDGTVVAVGYNISGQLNVSDWTNITAIAAGKGHTVGLKEDGTVVAVGSDASGQLNVSDWTNITAIAAGYSSTVGLKEDGALLVIGSYEYGQLNASDWTNIKAVVSGSMTTVGLKENGTVVGIGPNFPEEIFLWTDIKAVAYSSSSYHIGLKEDGTVVAVGYNVSDWTNIKAIAASSSHAVGLKEDGTVVAAGHYYPYGDGYGHLNVSSWTNIKAIAAGAWHTVGLKEDGTALAVGVYGFNYDVSSWTNIKVIDAGMRYIVGLKEDGTVVAVGDNSYGQLNVSDWTNIKAIAAKQSHTVGLKEDGTVVAVGDNSYGQLNVSGWTNIKAIDAGMWHTVGIKEDGTIVVVGAPNFPVSPNIKLPVCLDSIKPPVSLTTTDTPCDNGESITLSWALSSDDPAAGSGGNKVTGYNIYRANSSGGSYAAIGSVGAGTGSYIDSGAATGTTYYYLVRATDGVKESADSNEASAASVRNLPLAPTGLIASDTPYDLGGSITLAWTKSIDDGSGLGNVSAYNIYRYSAADGTIRAVTAFPAGTASYIDNSTVDMDTYYYFAKSFDSICNKESDASDIATGQSANNLTSLPGFITTLPGISSESVNSLSSKVENATTALNSGNTTTAVNILNALLNQISAQTGKKITTDAAATLNAYVQSLIEYIQN